jgi:hypothetical protein
MTTRGWILYFAHLDQQSAVQRLWESLQIGLKGKSLSTTFITSFLLEQCDLLEVYEQQIVSVGLPFYCSPRWIIFSSQ